MLALSEMNTGQERASASRLEIHSHDRCVRPLLYYHALANTAHRVRFGRRDFCPLPRLHQTATDTKHAFQTLKAMATTNAQWIPATQSHLSSLFSLLSSLSSLFSLLASPAHVAWRSRQSIDSTHFCNCVVPPVDAPQAGFPFRTHSQLHLSFLRGLDVRRAPQHPVHSASVIDRWRAQHPRWAYLQHRRACKLELR